jgi:hypothetical protein
MAMLFAVVLGPLVEAQLELLSALDRLYGLVVRVPGY